MASPFHLVFKAQVCYREPLPLRYCHCDMLMSGEGKQAVVKGG